MQKLTKMPRQAKIVKYTHWKAKPRIQRVLLGNEPIKITVSLCLCPCSLLPEDLVDFTFGNNAERKPLLESDLFPDNSKAELPSLTMLWLLLVALLSVSGFN